MYKLDKKIDEYSESLFTDLGLATLSEDEKADIYARVQDHLHSLMFQTLSPVIPVKDMNALRQRVIEEDYRKLENVLARYPDVKEELEEKIEEEYNNLKSIISEEHEHGRIVTPGVGNTI